MPRRVSAARIKAHRSYEIEELAETVGVGSQTVRVWIRQGLPALTEKRPFLILGWQAKAFLKARETDRKAPLAADEFWCLRCRKPRKAAFGLTEHSSLADGRPVLTGFCEVCETLFGASCTVQKLRRRPAPQGARRNTKRTCEPRLKPSLRTGARHMAQFHAENERIKRRYLGWMKEADGKDESTLDQVAAALRDFEKALGCKPFKAFHRDWARRYKSHLEKCRHHRTGKPLSVTTRDSRLRQVKGFFKWLASQPGYKSRVSFADVEYFNNTSKDARAAHAQRPVQYPSLEPGDSRLELRL